MTQQRKNSLISFFQNIKLLFYQDAVKKIKDKKKKRKEKTKI
jgi:hypothetical protein